MNFYKVIIDTYNIDTHEFHGNDHIKYFHRKDAALAEARADGRSHRIPLASLEDSDLPVQYISEARPAPFNTIIENPGRVISRASVYELTTED